MSVISGNVSLTITALNSSGQNLLPANSTAVQNQNRNYPPQQNFPVTGTTLRSVAGLPIPQAGLAIALPFDGVSLLYVHNTGVGNVNVTWTPSGGASASIIGLTPGAEFNLALPAAGGISALNLASTGTISITSANLPNNGTMNLAVASTSGLSVGQLIGTNTLSFPPLFQFSEAPITQINSSTQFTVNVAGLAFSQALTQVVPNTNQSLTLSAVAASSGGATNYTITGGGSNAFAGFQFIIAGFTNAANNGAFYCVASTNSTLTLSNGSAVLETHSGTATSSTANCGYLVAAPFGLQPNALVGDTVTITGFTNPSNNSSSIAPFGVSVTSSDGSGLGAPGFVIANANGIAETHAGLVSLVLTEGLTTIGEAASLLGEVEYCIIG